MYQAISEDYDVEFEFYLQNPTSYGIECFYENTNISILNSNCRYYKSNIYCK